jgi:hypothetical protein
MYTVADGDIIQRARLHTAMTLDISSSGCCNYGK